MKKVVALAFICATCFGLDKTVETVGEVVESVESSTTKIDHTDPTPSIIKKSELPEKVNTKQLPIAPVNIKKGKPVSLICYRGGLCLVKDTRTVKATSGVNKVIFENLYPGLIQESLCFRTPKKGRLLVLDYQFNKKDLSRKNLFSSAVGNKVFFSMAEGCKPEEGKLLYVSQENNGEFAVVSRDEKCFFIPIKQCVAVDEKTQNSISSNNLNLTFESVDSEDIDVEINYLTDHINWKHVCMIDVFEKLDRVDIFSQALLRNNTDFDLENVDITFDTSSPSLSFHDAEHKSVEIESNDAVTHNYKRNLFVKRNSDSMCMLRSAKELKPKLEYVVKIPESALNSDIVREIPVKNLLIIEDAKKLGIDVNFQDSEALIFRRINNERSFLGKQVLSSIKKGDDFVFEIGNASSIIANIQQTDFRRLSEKQFEYGVRVTVQNNKTEAATITVLLDVSSLWKITKKNTELQKADKPVWNLLLKPNESKELHFRMRISK